MIGSSSPGVLAIPVEGDAADRRPRLGDDAVLGAEVLHLALLEVGVDLDLVDPGTTVAWSRSLVR